MQKWVNYIGIAEKGTNRRVDARDIVPELQIAGKLHDLGNFNGVAKLPDEGLPRFHRKEFDARWASGDYMGLDVKVKPFQPDSTKGWLISDKFLTGTTGKRPKGEVDADMPRSWRCLCCDPHDGPKPSIDQTN